MWYWQHIFSSAVTTISFFSFFIRFSHIFFVYFLNVPIERDLRLWRDTNLWTLQKKKSLFCTYEAIGSTTKHVAEFKISRNTKFSSLSRQQLKIIETQSLKRFFILLYEHIIMYYKHTFTERRTPSAEILVITIKQSFLFSILFFEEEIHF